MKKRLFLLGVVGALVLAVLVPAVVLANNEASQTASTSRAGTLEIRDQLYTTSVSAVIFPESIPGATVSRPYNAVNGFSSPQSFGTGTSKPVLTVVNTTEYAYNILYTVTTFTNGVVDAEYYLVGPKGGDVADEAAVSTPVVFDTLTATGGSIAATGDAGDNDMKDVYLKIDLSGVGGKTGISLISILGETA
jgi:hypothetical protein